MKRILIADDTANIIQVTRLFLEKAGYEVVAFMNPVDALRYATRNSVQLYILDIMMPGIDGYTMARILKKNSHTKNVPIILMSARGLLLDTPKDIKYNVYGFIEKPFAKTTLLQAVEKSLLTAYHEDLEIEYR